jgi:hypothetical protein
MNKTKKTSKSIAVLASGLALAAATGSGAAIANTANSAGTSSTSASVRAEGVRAAGLSQTQADQLQRSIDKQLATMKVPARQVSYNTIRTEDGSTSVTLTAPGQARDSSCRSGRLCLWAGDNYDHAKIVFWRCGFRNLGDVGWSDRLTSFKNYQTTGTRAKFYNWRSGGGWQLLFGSTARHSVPDLQGTGYNNMVDAVRVC